MAFAQASPTATPTPVPPPMCSVTGLILGPNGSPPPFPPGQKVYFSSGPAPQIRGSSVILPNTTFSTQTDVNGNLAAVNIPQGLKIFVLFDISSALGTQHTIPSTSTATLDTILRDRKSTRL